MSSHQKTRLFDIIEKSPYQKTILIAAIIAFLVLELFICIAAVNHTGNKSKIIISDKAGTVLYETMGQVLSTYDRQSFENTFGSLNNYMVSVHVDVRPFPFRAWLAAAIGIPVGLILLLSFLVRVYMALMYGEAESASPLSDFQNHTGLAGFSFSSFFYSLQRFSIFSLGFIIVLGVLILWLVPSLLGDALRTSIDVIREFKWFFLGTSVILAGIAVWIIHLRYRLSRLHLENQLALEKFRIEKQLPAPSGMGMTLISDTLTMPSSRKEG